MKKIIIVLLLAIATCTSVKAQPSDTSSAEQSLASLRAWVKTQGIDSNIRKQTFVYAVKDSSQLGLDVYTIKGTDSSIKKPCVIFVFGGAFIAGHRDDPIYNDYFNKLVQNNYIVISISYRLGLKGAKNLSKFNITPLRDAIDMAVEDVYDATSWVISHRDELGIDTAMIVLSGSSSGAITILNADFKNKNGNDENKLPKGFGYAGIVAFSGAILSFDGSLKYKVPPAPTMMFHGTADKIVPYNKIRFFNKGFYGSSSIASTFRENNYPYYIFRETGMGHEISVFPMFQNLPDILGFLDSYVRQKKPYQKDMTFYDPDQKPILTISAGDLFKKLQAQKQNGN